MTNFYKLNEQKLREKFQKQIAEVGSLGSVGDPHSRETMFSSFVLQEEAAAKQGVADYQLAQENQISSRLSSDMKRDMGGPPEPTPIQKLEAAQQAYTILHEKNLIDGAWIAGYGGVESDDLKFKPIDGPSPDGSVARADVFGTGNGGIEVYLDELGHFEDNLNTVAHELRHFHGPNMRKILKAWRESGSQENAAFLNHIDRIAAEQENDNYGYDVVEAWREFERDRDGDGNTHD